MLTTGRIFLAFCILFLLSMPKAQASKELTLLYHPPESELDHRYDFHWQVLEAALDATKKNTEFLNLNPQCL